MDNIFLFVFESMGSFSFSLFSLEADLWKNPGGLPWGVSHSPDFVDGIPWYSMRSPLLCISCNW